MLDRPDLELVDYSLQFEVFSLYIMPQGTT